MVHNDAAHGGARVGLAVHGFVYVLIGVLALALAFGSRRGETDSHGALDELTQHAGGQVLVLAIALGLGVYALWQLSRVIVTGGDAGTRAEAAFSVIVNAALSASAFSVALGGHASNQSRKQQAWTARVMAHTDGRWLVGVVGLVVIVVGIVIAVRGIRRSFESDLDLTAADEKVQNAVLTLGLVGNVARGVVVGLAGVLVLVSAIQFDPKDSRGLDGALRALRDTAAGPWLLIAVALGLLMFGIFGIAEAKYRRL